MKTTTYKEKIKLNQTQKNEVYDLIGSLVNMSLKVRREGLLSLEDDMSEGNIPYFLMRKGLEFVTAGYDPDYIKEILNNFVESSLMTEFDNLICKIIVNGMLSIQRGDNPRTTYELLISFLGIPEGEKNENQDYNLTPSKDSLKEKIENMIEEIRDQFKITRKSDYLNGAISSITKNDLYKTIKSIEFQDIVIVFLILDLEMIKKILRSNYWEHLEVVISELKELTSYSPEEIEEYMSKAEGKIRGIITERMDS